MSLVCALLFLLFGHALGRSDQDGAHILGIMVSQLQILQRMAFQSAHGMPVILILAIQGVASAIQHKIVLTY